MKKYILFFVSFFFVVLSSCVKKPEGVSDPENVTFNVSSEPLVFLIPEEIKIQSGQFLDKGSMWEFHLFERSGIDCYTPPSVMRNRAQIGVGIDLSEGAISYPKYWTDVPISFFLGARKSPISTRGKLAVLSRSVEDGIIKIYVDAEAKSNTGKIYKLIGQSEITICN